MTLSSLSCWLCCGVLVSLLIFIILPLLPQTDGLPESLGAEKKVKGRTGWPQQVWALELNQWHPLLHPKKPPQRLWIQIRFKIKQTTEWTWARRCGRAAMRKKERTKGQQGGGTVENSRTDVFFSRGVVSKPIYRSDCRCLIFVVFLLSWCFLPLRTRCRDGGCQKHICLPLNVCLPDFVFPVKGNEA